MEVNTAFGIVSEICSVKGPQTRRSSVKSAGVDNITMIRVINFERMEGNRCMHGKNPERSNFHFYKSLRKSRYPFGDARYQVQ